MLLLFRFFFTRRGVLEMNGLDKIARRSKRVGGAIADLLGSNLVGTHYVVEKSFCRKKFIPWRLCRLVKTLAQPANDCPPGRRESISRPTSFSSVQWRGRWGCRPSEEADSGSTDLGQPSSCWLTLGREACDSPTLSARLLPTMSRGHFPNDRDLVAGLGLFPL